MKIKKIKRYEKEELRYRRKEDRRQENEILEDMRMYKRKEDGRMREYKIE